MDRQQYYMKIAERTALRSTCRVAVGAVAVKDKRIIGTAYNGAPSGMDECVDVGCHKVHGHCQRAIHAEQNIITLAARFGFSLSGVTIYCTHEPCASCMKLLISAGIEKIYFIKEYKDERTLPAYYNLMEVYQYAENETYGDMFIRFRRTNEK